MRKYLCEVKSMGNELTRRNCDQPCDDAMLPRIMNNVNPLKFHSVHGELVELSKYGTAAKRYDGFCKGIAFSHRPVAINEYIFVKFVDISNSWSGALRIGFTAHDPVTYRNKLPKYACPYMTEVTGNWARALAERLVKKNSVLFYYVNHNGDVHYGFDNEEKGIFFSGVNTSGKLWALLDIYGNTVEIEFMDPHYYSRESQNDNSRCVNFNRPNRNVSDMAEECQMVSKPLATDINFHKIHGKDVFYKTKKVVRGGFGGHGYVFLNRPIHLDEVVVMQVSKDVDIFEGSFIFGVTSCNPSEIMGDLPDDPDYLVDRAEYWVVQKEEILNSDQFVFALRKDGALMFRKNFGLLSVVAFVDNTLPLWFFINLLATSAEMILIGSYIDAVDDEFISCVLEKRNMIQDPRLKHTMDLPANDGDECVICYEAESDSALYRCGHACMCYECALQVYHGSNPYCPVCRTKIIDVLKIFK